MGKCRVVALDDNLDAFLHAGDREPGSYHRVFGRSDHLPFTGHSFDLIVCHHVLEHVPALHRVLGEMARVLKPDGRLYVAVPNGYGLCDAIYRFVFEGGGHINQLAREPLAGLIERSVGVHLVRWQKLYSSFAYLRRLRTMTALANLRPRLRMLQRFPRTIGAAQWLLYLGTRLIDRIFRTDLAVWALYFDRSAGVPIEDRAYLNVCLYCGAGHHALSLYRPLRLTYRCQICDHINPYVAPFRNTT